MAMLAGFTWYIRKGSKQDAENVVRGTAAQSTSEDILKRVKVLESEVSQVKNLTMLARGVDHRGPKGNQDGKGV